MSVLVTGGAGYIGSVTAEALRARGREVVVLDDLSTGHRAAVPDGVSFLRGSAGNAALLGDLLRRREITSVMHFAARSIVAESVADPALYWRINVDETLALLGALREPGIRHFIFSSSAAVYEGGEGTALSEKSPLAPGNPYGATKAAVERALADFSSAYGMRAVSLRYFNAAGATSSHGEDHRPETHLVPLALRAARGEGGELDLYGTDYPTRDGTCVRDYVHVSDLADAHVLALEALEAGYPGGALNLGNGRGFSVREVIETVEDVTGRRVPVREAPRRPGDPGTLVAGSEKAREDLGWRPRFAAIREIIASAAAWMETHPGGYGPAGPGPAEGGA
ncbi:MAG: UDP-glucose 4-epimerase GalE [Deltaproteobacteria bacterium]|nr:UDP-glucose 4-epimerase GalE [Deltaproteobacteria bacterium]